MPGILLTVALVAVVIVAAFAVWIWWLLRNTAVPVWLVMIPASLAALSTVLGLITGSIKVFAAAGGEAIDPPDKASILASAASEGFICSAPGLLALVVWLLIITWSYHWAKRGRQAGS